MSAKDQIASDTIVIVETYLWQSKVCRDVSIFLRSNNLTVLSVEPVATTHSLKGLKARQFTCKYN
jgi:hypothetical protein